MPSRKNTRPARYGLDCFFIDDRNVKFTAEIWQPGFSEVRIKDRQSFLRHREYIEQNPVKARLVDSPEKFPYSAYFKAQKSQQGLKPKHKLPSGATEVAP